MSDLGWFIVGSVWSGLWYALFVTLRFLSVWGCSVLVMSVRQLIPEDLAEIPPGPELARVLSGLELSRLSGFDCVEVLKAQYRQANHERARVLAAMVEVGLCGVVPASDELRRRAAPGEFSADEIRAALVLTRRAAEDQFGLAWDLVTRLPQVHAAMVAGVLDEPRARVFSEWTLELSPEQAQAVCATLLPRVPKLTTGQLIEQIKKLALAIDPDWARRRYEQAVAERKVVGYRNPDGSANLSGRNLPLDRVAAASGHIDALAKAVKRAGDARPIDHIRAELFLGMTDGSYTGLDDATIIELLTTTPDPDTDHPNTDRDDSGHGDSGGEVNCNDNREPDDHEPDDHDPDTPAPDDNGPDDNGPGDGGPGGGEQAGEGGSRVSGAPPVRSSWGAGVELRVRLSTLLGCDQYPAELAGWGPVYAELARDLAATLGGAQWRFAITDEHGQLTHSGITRARPTGTPTRAAACRAIVELQIPATTLRALATEPSTAGSWAGVVADLTAQLDHHLPDHSQDCGDAARRGPGAALRRSLEIRDRSCTMIGCRAPAHGTDQDHTHDHALGGPTIGPNLGGAPADTTTGSKARAAGGCTSPNPACSAGLAPPATPTIAAHRPSSSHYPTPSTATTPRTR